MLVRAGLLDSARRKRAHRDRRHAETQALQVGKRSGARDLRVILAGGRRYDEPVPRGSRFDGNTMYRRRYCQPALFAAVAALSEVAASEGRSVLELAYGYVAGHPGVGSVLVGPGSVAHLDDALAAVAHPLSEALRRRVEAVHVGLVGTDARYAR